ncbi:hypothetical protein [Lacticaseibacillus songhuajiangensis]|uniref:hypothetical protein n=1 Tax=Lacticaseibacillus songhuajiangensis TaxID=1296539 RepID=UPI000F76FCF3|nr:hypothetical protein [Lacticaseibacillus songhuajiangensis]
MGLEAKQVEQISVGYLDAILPRITGIDADLVIHNNGALTDGTVSLYKNQKQTIENFEQTIAVQVKGSTNSKIFSGKRPTFRKISRTSIEKYRQLGGLLLFVVTINPSSKQATHVLYKILSPYRITRLLDNTAGMKYPPIKLSYFPESSEEQLGVLRQAAYDLSHDHSENLTHPVKLKPEKITIPTFQMKSALSAGPDALENRELLAYGHAEGVEWVISEILPENMTLFVQHGKVQMRFPNQTQFSGVIVETKRFHKPPITEIRTGHEQMIRIMLVPQQENQGVGSQLFSGKIYLHVAATLEHEIENTEAFLSLLKTPILIVNQNIIDLSSYIPENRTSKIEEISNRLNVLEIKKEAGKMLGVDFYDVQEMSDDDIQTLEALFSLYRNRDTNQKIERLMLSIGNHDHAIIVVNDFVSTLFDKRVEQKLKMLAGPDEESTDLIVVNPYTMIDGNIHLSKIPDFSPKLILNWFREHPDELISERQRLQTEYYCLNLLMEYKEMSDNRMLQLAVNIHKQLKIQGDQDKHLFFIEQLIQIISGSKRTMHDLNLLLEFTQSQEIEVQIVSKALLGAESSDLQNDIDLFPQDEPYAIYRSIMQVLWA